MSKPQHSKRDRAKQHEEAGYRPSPFLLDYDGRRNDALNEALRYLSEKPPRITLARQAIQAALDPAAPRWGDQ